MTRTALLLLIAVTLTACGRERPPQTAQPAAAPPAPVATSTPVPDSGGGGDKALAPLDRAKAVEGQLMDNTEERKKEIDEQSK